MASDTQDEAFTVRTLKEFRALVEQNNATTITENSQINLVSEYCRISECKPYTPPDIAFLFHKILWANWAISALVTFVGIIVMYRKWIKVSGCNFQYSGGYFISAETNSRRLALLCHCVWLHSNVKIHMGTRKNHFNISFSQNCTIIR